MYVFIRHARKRKPPGSDHANAASRQEIGPMKDNLKRQRNEALVIPESGGSPRVEQRVSAADCEAINAALDANGFATMAGLLDAEACGAIARLYTEDNRFRSHVHMARHGFGCGEYKYFAYPLPDAVGALRTALYPPLASIANRWNDALGEKSRFPLRHTDFLKRCHEAGQTRPTPLLLKYEAGDYNCLHQDLYGEHVFPLQVAILLCEPDEDFTGGEFVLTEQRPRMQSRASVVPLRRGDAAIFAVRHRPVRGVRGS